MSTTEQKMMQYIPRLRGVYNDIRQSEAYFPLREEEPALTDESIKAFQRLLNEAQPINEEEAHVHAFVQHLYRKNSRNFNEFIMRSGLRHLALWTEAKYIVRHFGLQGIIYIKWDEGSYQCSWHNSVKLNEDGTRDYSAVIQRRNHRHRRD